MSRCAAPAPLERCICRRLRLGLLSRAGFTRLSVPAGHVAVLDDGQLLPPGRHPVRGCVTAWLVLMERLPLTVSVPALLTGGPDGELVDVTAAFSVSAVAADRLAARLDAAQSLTVQAVADGFDQALRACLPAVVRQYLASDLAGAGPAASKVQQALEAPLAAAAESWGLELEEITAMQITLSADAVLAARRRRDLEHEAAEAAAERPDQFLTRALDAGADRQPGTLLELRRLRQALREARSGAYWGGDLALALFLRSLENRIALALDESGEVGPYASLTASGDSFTLAADARRLADAAQRLGRQIRAGAETAAGWKALEADLLELLQPRTALSRSAWGASS